MPNQVNEIFKAANRPLQGDNRSYYVRCLNKILTDGFIKFEIAPQGIAFTNNSYRDKDGNLIQFNLEIKGYGFVRRSFCKGLSAELILQAISKFIKSDKVSEHHTKSLEIYGNKVIPCEKCQSKGVIPTLMHVCDGMCFDCYGTKYLVKSYKISI